MFKPESFTVVYAAAEKSPRRTLLVQLQNGGWDPSSASDFKKVLGLAINACGISRSTIADMTQTSLGTVGRWCSGQVVPHVLIRRCFFEDLEEYLDNNS